jgi:hypothetical protein
VPVQPFEKFPSTMRPLRNNLTFFFCETQYTHAHSPV